MSGRKKVAGTAAAGAQQKRKPKQPHHEDDDPFAELAKLLGNTQQDAPPSKRHAPRMQQCARLYPSSCCVRLLPRRILNQDSSRNPVLSSKAIGQASLSSLLSCSRAKTTKTKPLLAVENSSGEDDIDGDEEKSCLLDFSSALRSALAPAACRLCSPPE